MRNRFFQLAVAAASLILGLAEIKAAVVSFGSGANQFQMEFVTIGNPGNAADTTGKPNPAGAVGYTYGIGKFEVSEDMIDKYNASQAGGILQITKDRRGPNKPATSVSWNEAARFVNWLNTSTGHMPAYKYNPWATSAQDGISLWQSSDVGYDASNPYRNRLAKYFLPSYNEWYKAAYYSPIDSTYYVFPNGSNMAPTPVASGTGANEAVYGHSYYHGPADVDKAGGLSPYGVMGLGGNVDEWEESSFDLANSYFGSLRGYRGGNWYGTSPVLLSSHRNNGYLPTLDRLFEVGFRVASLSSSAPPAVPEPSMMVIGTLFGLGGLLAKRRMKK
jgi:sulfatase modifying factor 1